MPSACSTSKNIESVVTAEALTEEATKEENTEDIKEEEEEECDGLKLVCQQKYKEIVSK